VVIAVVFIVAVVAIPVLVALARGGGFSPGDKVGVVSLTGVIHSGATRSLFGALSGADVVIGQLRQAEEDASVKAVVLKIDSPGGSAAASASIYRAVQRLQAKKPVVVSMGDVAASGGYYSASAAGTIMANPATETGSIGVIMHGMNYSGLMNRYGVTDQTIATGPYKDTGSPERPMRPDERIYIKTMLLDIYDQFVTDVAAGRRMDVAAVRKLADGRVYTGRQAKKLHLVDELGDYRDALELAWKKAGLTGEPRTKTFGHTSLLDTMLEDSVRILPRSASPQQMLVEQALQQQSASGVDLLMMPGYYETQAR
jgi:protease-4